MSTVGLLATTNRSNGGDLLLIDTSGILRCRAYAIGKYSTQLNERLMKENFEHLTVEEGSKLLLRILQECSAGGHGVGVKEINLNIDLDNVHKPWDLPMQTFAEILIVDSMHSKVKRLRQPLIIE